MIEKTNERLVWTPAEVRGRLRRYNEDDSLYDARIARPSQICIAHTSSSDSMPKMIYKILKRADLDMAIKGALLPVRVITKEQKRKKRLYHLIRLAYVYDQGVEGVSESWDISRATAYRMESEAIGFIVDWLNLHDPHDEG